MLLIFFGLALSSSWGNGHATTYRSLLRGLRARGHRVIFYERDVPWYGGHRDLERPDYAEVRLFAGWRDIRATALAAARTADAVVVGSYCGEAIAILDDLLSVRPRRLAFYDIDTPVTIAALDHGRCEYLRPDQLAAVDLYLSFTSGPILKELRRRGARCVRPLHCCADPEHYRPGPPIPPRWDLGYLGTYAPDRQDKLRRLLLEPARRLPGQRFVVAGPMYSDQAGWPLNVEYLPHVPPGDHPTFYRSCRMTLSITRRAMVAWGHSPSIRLFEAAACEAPIITDPWPGLDEFFRTEQRPGEPSEVLVASDAGTVVRYLRELSPLDLRRIARAARGRVLRHHTGLHRAEQLESYLQKIAP
ncbi:MAG: CgeB family protein [Terriglobales bacterium]